MTALPLKKSGVMKCSPCRVYRQKCIPTDPEITERIWIEGGQRDKCARCAKLGHACGPPEYSTPNQQADPGSPIAVPQKRRASAAAQALGQDQGIDHTQIMQGGPGSSQGLSGENFALRSRLKEIDRRLEALKFLNKDIASCNLIDGDPESQSHFQSLCDAKEATLSKLLAVLRLAKDSAAGMEDSGKAPEAYVAYTRVLDGYHKLNEPAYYEIRCVLTKMATMLWANKDEYLAQELAWQALESRAPLDGAQESDVNVLKNIAKSLSQVSAELSQAIHFEMPGQAMCPLPPPLHFMIESGYAYNVPGNIFRTGLHPDIDNGKSPESPIVGGVNAVVDFLEEFSDTDLDVRDSKKRSALFLAASLCKEGLGLGLMIRAKHDLRLLKRLVNARDGSGQTVLSAAITSGCSLPFITALINNGAEVEPGTLPRANTPLQAACYIGSLEVVDLLVRRGANIDTAYIGSSTPLAIAQELGHFEIINRLSYSSPGSLNSHTFQEGDCGG